MDWIQHYDVKIKMRDGVELACDIRMPAQGGPFPAVLLRTPYNKNVHPESNRMDNITQYLDNGYAMVIMDVRGKYESDGIFPVLSFRQEGEDSADTIKWLAEQPWCNGKVAMTGASYCGYVQIYAALEHPEALCAISPGVFGNDGFRNIIRRDGIPQMSLLIWALHNATGRVAKILLFDWQKLLFSMPLRNLVNTCGLRRKLFDHWMKHNRNNRLWEEMGRIERMQELDVPVFLSGGWYDLYSSAVVETFCFLQSLPHMHNKVTLMMGPWLHGLGAREAGVMDFGPAADVDITEENRHWLDCWCREGRREAFPTVRYFVMGINEWREADKWPPVPIEEEFLLLACNHSANSLEGDGRLADMHGETPRDTYVYDPADPVLNLGGNLLAFGDGMAAGPCDQRPMEKRKDMLVYTGEVLAESLEVVGRPEVELYISSDAPDTDFVVRLCDVYPDGRSINICTGIIRTRYREGFDREIMMIPGEIYKLRIPLDITAVCFLPGHCLRLEITSSCFPQFGRNHNTGGDNWSEADYRKATQIIYHSAEYPSRLLLPVSVAIPASDHF